MNLKFPLYIPYLTLFQTSHIPYSTPFQTRIMAPKPPVSTYERMTGGCTRVLAAQILSLITPHAPITPTSHILDNACGPGIVTAEIKTRYPDAKIMATDLSPGMIAEVQAKTAAEGWRDVTTAVLDARDLKGVQGETFSHVVTNLGLPAPGEREESVRGVGEVFRVLKTGGVAVMSTWAGMSPSRNCISFSCSSIR
jgi:ubiquinone/menaquinone biosynthesis C-methylase UbiE